MKRGPLETAMLEMFRTVGDYNNATPQERKEMRDKLKEVRELEAGIDPTMAEFFAGLTGLMADAKMAQRENE